MPKPSQNLDWTIPPETPHPTSSASGFIYNYSTAVTSYPLFASTSYPLSSSGVSYPAQVHEPKGPTEEELKAAEEKRVAYKKKIAEGFVSEEPSERAIDLHE